MKCWIEDFKHLFTKREDAPKILGSQFVITKNGFCTKAMYDGKNWMIQDPIEGLIPERVYNKVEYYLDLSILTTKEKAIELAKQVAKEAGYSPSIKKCHDFINENKNIL